MLSYGEVALIFVAGAVCFGPKDIPLVAKTAGRLVGRAAGYVSTARNAFGSFAEKTQINELHAELQQTIAQLDAIRYELRSGIMFTPTGHSEVAAISAKKEITPGSGQLQEKLLASGKLKTIQTHVQSLDLQAEALKQRQSERRKIKSDISSIEVLPVSAVRAGLIPSRNGAACGADILSDAIIEERVARDALKFIRPIDAKNSHL